MPSMHGFSEEGAPEWEEALGTVLGYRWWKLRLCPIAGLDPLAQQAVPTLTGRSGHSWDRMERENGLYTAKCDGWQLPGACCDAPDPECGCGFWAYWRPNVNPWSPHAPLSDGNFFVLGQIEGSGRTILGTKGFRCEKAKIGQLVIINGCERESEGELETLMPGIPVASAIDHDHAVRTIKALTRPDPLYGDRFPEETAADVIARASNNVRRIGDAYVKLYSSITFSVGSLPYMPFSSPPAISDTVTYSAADIKLADNIAAICKKELAVEILKQAQLPPDIPHGTVS